jgi:hypothetical protein
MPMGRKPRLLILECTSASAEGMSEGKLMWELMRILGLRKRTKFLLIHGRTDFLNNVEKMEEPYLHISAHGDFSPKKGTWINVPHSGKILPNDMTRLWEDRRASKVPKLVVLSACESGHTDMVRAFSDSGCRYCIAPLHETYWEDAAVFSTVLYKLLIGENSSPWVSYKKSMLAVSTAVPRLTGAWSFYDRGEKVLLE